MSKEELNTPAVWTSALSDETRTGEIRGQILDSTKFERPRVMNNKKQMA
jgi:hypothetical protein